MYGTFIFRLILLSHLAFSTLPPDEAFHLMLSYIDYNKHKEHYPISMSLELSSFRVSSPKKEASKDSKLSHFERELSEDSLGNNSPIP
jgi:hypothetical protein